jgi:anti-anti-sigma factor
MTSLNQSASSAVAEHGTGRSETSFVQQSIPGHAEFSLDDVDLFDEWLVGGDYAQNVLLSLANLVSLDSRHIGRLVTAHKRFSQAGGKLVIHSIRPQAMETVRFLRLDRVLHIAEDRRAAEQLL